MEQDQQNQKILEKMMRGDLARGATAEAPQDRPDEINAQAFDSNLVEPLRLALKAGNIPAELAHRVHVGGAELLRAFAEDLSRLETGGSCFRFLVGFNGEGKSHLLNLVATIARAKGFVVLRAEISPQRRFQGNKGEVRNLINELMRTLSFKVSTKEKGLADLQEIIGITARKHTDKILEKALAFTCAPLLHHPGGPEMLEVITAYCRASDAQDMVGAAKALAWFRAEYSTPVEAKKALGIMTPVTDWDLTRHLRLLSALAQTAGQNGVLVLVDELSVLTRNLHGPLRQANQDAILNLLNDVSAGRLPNLGFMLAGTPDALDGNQRGLLGSAALKSRLQTPGEPQTGGLVLAAPKLSREEMVVMLQKVRRLRLPETVWKENLPDEALQAVAEKSLRALGAAEGLSPRDLLKSFEMVVEKLEGRCSGNWRDAVGETVTHRGPSPGSSKSNALERLRL